MSMTPERSLIGCALALTVASGAAAEAPRVATDIAPVHGLVARVMEGLGTPDLIVQPGSSPHDYAMRPSEARALDRADAVFWVGPALEPWLDETIDTLAADALVVELLDAPGLDVLAFREGAVFDDHDHEHGEAHADEEHAGHEGEEDHADHEGEDHADHAHEDDHAGHEDEASHDEHAHDDHDDHGHDDHEDHADGGHEGHDHDGIDPHAWLDPENGKVWLGLIADELAALDPDNAETYRANAAAGREEIDAATAGARETLNAAGEIGFVVFHDAYHYYETRFGLSAAGAISLSDASDPSPARIEEVRDRVRDLGVACVFSEPQFNQSLVATVTEGTEAKAAVIDPLGFDLEPGPGFYPELIRAIADDIAGCAS
ncbi:zinc ABC transporter substrate-binding protein [Limimaricola hongkongensis]|uniref:High-affinity zinc uptake system protein ZnuA n=1 Tax=Limimaricola hongkongensis DSM 17492 TaxID=1122180 RepID=A0A017HDM1_9RHOB|nr:zinc ABC transporter substrate-binding protein [Limimaricola hongkongensis]EYD72567.1 Zinc ABC transporter, periplasmic-binding protein ZnuA [Limimaricola hongkongensis DSM 17492]